jgi:hypothetical protein
LQHPLSRYAMSLQQHCTGAGGKSKCEGPRGRLIR